jgi:hypothetical protein
MDAKQVILDQDPKLWAYQWSNHPPFLCIQWEWNQICICEKQDANEKSHTWNAMHGKCDLQRTAVLWYEEEICSHQYHNKHQT